MSLKELSVTIWNEYDNGDIASNILVLAGKIKSDTETQEVIYENYNNLQQAIKDYEIHKRNNDIVEHYKNIFEELLSLSKRIDDGTIQGKNVNIQRIKIVDIASLNKLSDDFEEIRNQFALILRSLSISIYNAFEDINLSLEIIKYAQLIHVDNETYNSLASAYNQLQEIIGNNKRREEELNFNTSIRGDLVSINANKVTYKNKSLITKDINKIRFGVYITSINGIRSSYYTIWYGDKSGNVIEIECNRLLNSIETVENQYRQILEASYNTVIPCILKNIESYFNNGHIKLDDWIVNKEGINYETGALFWKESHLVKWQDVDFSSAQGVLYVKNKLKNQVIGNFGFRDHWNAVIFQLIKEYIVGIKG